MPSDSKIFSARRPTFSIGSTYGYLVFTRWCVLWHRLRILDKPISPSFIRKKRQREKDSCICRGIEGGTYPMRCVCELHMLADFWFRTYQLGTLEDGCFSLSIHMDEARNVCFANNIRSDLSHECDRLLFRLHSLLSRVAWDIARRHPNQTELMVRSMEAGTSFSCIDRITWRCVLWRRAKQTGALILHIRAEPSQTNNDISHILSAIIYLLLLFSHTLEKRPLVSVPCWIWRMYASKADRGLASCIFVLYYGCLAVAQWCTMRSIILPLVSNLHVRIMGDKLCTGTYDLCQRSKQKLVLQMSTCIQTQ